MAKVIKTPKKTIKMFEYDWPDLNKSKKLCHNILS